MTPVIASQTINAAMTTDANSTTVAVPSGTSNGNLLVLFSCNEGVYPYQSLTGWTLLQTDTQDGAADCDGAFWWRTASSEPASYTLKMTSSNKGLIFAAMFNITGFNASSPIRTSAVTKSGATAVKPSPAPGTLTGVGASDLVIVGYGYGASAQTTTMPTMAYPTTGSWTQLGTSGPSHTSSSDYQGALLMVSKTAGTDTPTASALATGGWVVMSVAIAAASEPGSFLPFFMS